MDNEFTYDEIEAALSMLGVYPRGRSGGLRSECPIHHGDNPLAFAAWRDSGGAWRFSCHSHQCVRAASLEWVVAKAKNCHLKDAVEWLSQKLSRSLFVPDTNKQRDLVLMPTVQDDICFCDQDALNRLTSTYPYHDYWASRGYSKDIVSEYRLTYRGLDKRMVIPVFDEVNQFVGMMTRTTDPNDPIKYRWESPNSSKSRWLFGVPQALKRPLVVDGRRVVFLVEGTLDPLHAAECGFPVVASQTNRLSMEQVTQLIGRWDLVILIPDNDGPGQHLVHDAKKLAAPFLEIGVVILNKGVKDLDEVPLPELPGLLNKTIEDWRKAWRNAPRRQRSFLNLNQSASAA